MLGVTCDHVVGAETWNCYRRLCAMHMQSPGMDQVKLGMQLVGKEDDTS